MTQSKMKFRRKHPDGRVFEKPNSVWPNPWLARFDRCIKQGLEIKEDLWEKVISNTGSEQRILINKHKHGEGHYLVTPDTLEQVCANLVKAWYIDKWFYDEDEVRALKAIRDGTCFEFWRDYDGEYLSVTLETFSNDYTPKEWKDVNLEERISLAEATERDRKAREKTARVTRLKSKQDDLQSEIDAILNE